MGGPRKVYMVEVYTGNGKENGHDYLGSRVEDLGIKASAPLQP